MHKKKKNVFTLVRCADPTFSAHICPHKLVHVVEFASLLFNKTLTRKHGQLSFRALLFTMRLTGGAAGPEVDQIKIGS